MRSRSRSRASSWPSLPSSSAFAPMAKMIRITCNLTERRNGSSSAIGHWSPAEKIEHLLGMTLDDMAEILSWGRLLVCAGGLRLLVHRV
jgi:hypothetical protein